MDYAHLAGKIKEQAHKLGFLDSKIAPYRLPDTDTDGIKNWLAQGYYGDMHYLPRHGLNRTNARYILPEAKSILLLALPYWSETFTQSKEILNSPEQAYISRYALGRDYHKVLRSKLKILGGYLSEVVPAAHWRGVVDSAPLAEVAFSTLGGLGWKGKNTLLLQKQAGSLFFLGALITDLPLPHDKPTATHCGTCRRCIQECPTQAIVAPYVVDARRCLSYLTIETPELIDEVYRKAMGNRIYGCDDCQLVCPFNRFAPPNQQVDFKPRHQLDRISLLELLSWQESDFKTKMAGSPIYRIGYNKWLSNIIIALGNAPEDGRIIASLQPYLNHSSAMLQQAAHWSLRQHHHE